jgi:hypothetical protein
VWSLIYRRRAAVVSLTLLVAGVLPVAFIAQRSLEAVYVPSLGAVILLALPLAHIFTRPLPALLAALLLAGGFHHLRRDLDREAHLSEANLIASVSRQLRETAPCLRKGAHVLFRRDPFPRFDWNSLFLVRLLYSDREIVVHRPGRQSEPPEHYDVVFDWDDGHGLLRRINRETTRASTAPNNTPSK